MHRPVARGLSSAALSLAMGQSFLALVAYLTVCAAQQNSPRRNVLFVVVDDMRPNIGKTLFCLSGNRISIHTGAYNFSLAHTPTMDKLADEGMMLTRAYVQALLP